MKYLLITLLMVGCGHAHYGHNDVVEVQVEEIPPDVVEEKLPPHSDLVICHSWKTGNVIYGPVKADLIAKKGDFAYIVLTETKKGVRVCGDCYFL